MILYKKVILFIPLQLISSKFKKIKSEKIFDIHTYNVLWHLAGTNIQGIKFIHYTKNIQYKNYPV